MQGFLSVHLHTRLSSEGNECFQAWSFWSQNIARKAFQIKWFGKQIATRWVLFAKQNSLITSLNRQVNANVNFVGSQMISSGFSISLFPNSIRDEKSELPRFQILITADSRISRFSYRQWVQIWNDFHGYRTAFRIDIWARSSSGQHSRQGFQTSHHHNIVKRIAFELAVRSWKIFCCKPVPSHIQVPLRKKYPVRVKECKWKWIFGIPQLPHRTGLAASSFSSYMAIRPSILKHATLARSQHQTTPFLSRCQWLPGCC